MSEYGKPLQTMPYQQLAQWLERHWPAAIIRTVSVNDSNVTSINGDISMTSSPYGKLYYVGISFPTYYIGYNSGQNRLEISVAGNGIYISSAGRVTFSTVPTEYADNAAAIAAGLTAGQIYRTGDALKIVHS